MFSGQISSICWLAPAITSTPGLQLDAQQKCFATASETTGFLGANLMNKRSVT